MATIGTTRSARTFQSIQLNELVELLAGDKMVVEAILFA